MGQTTSSSTHSLLSFNEEFPAKLPTSESLSLHGGAALHHLSQSLSKDASFNRWLVYFGYPRALSVWMRSTSPSSSPLAAAADTSSSTSPPPPISTVTALGFIVTRIVDCEAFCHALYIINEERGCGAGRALAAATRERLLTENGVFVLWPIAPCEKALEFARTAIFGSSEIALAAYLILHGKDDDVGVKKVFEFTHLATHKDTFLSLSSPGACASAARDNHWDITRLTKEFAEFLHTKCEWQEEHALAVALMACGEVFITNQEEEEEEDDDDDVEEGSGSGGGGGDDDDGSKAAFESTKRARIQEP